MKKILLLALLFIGTICLNAQVTGQTYSDITTHGRGGNSTRWVAEYVFTDSGDTRIGPFSVDQSPIGIAVTRDAVYDTIDGYHWDSSWTASDFAFLLGAPRVLNDSARAVFTLTDSLDFWPVIDSDGDRVVSQADSMSYTVLKPIEQAGAKYMYVEFYDSDGDSLVIQRESRTLVLFYREY